jgi:hypothetical protein
LFSKFETVIGNCNSQHSAYARVITTTQEKNNTLLNQIKKKQFEVSIALLDAINSLVLLAFCMM